MAEKTPDQVLVTTGVDGVLAKKRRATMTQADWSRKVRQMRHDATLGFVRDLFMAPFFASDWTVVADDPKYKPAVQEVYDSTVPHRDVFLENATRGLLDFGWQPFEVVRDLDSRGYTKITMLKPLLQDITEILVDDYGRMIGVRNQPTYLGLSGNIGTHPLYTELYGDECLVVNRDVEGTNWYGDALMYRAERAYDSWLDSDDAASKHDQKIAGAHWVINYPVGKSLIDGELVDNYQIAKDMLAQIDGTNRHFVVPRKIAEHIEDLNSLDDSKLAWKIELLEASGSSESTFVGRQKYLDALKARALGIPERAVFEGQFGTKAEAEAHADFAISNIEMSHTKLVTQFNRGVVDPMLLVNRGPAFVGKVRVQATPLSDWQRGQLRQMFSAYLASSEGAAEEIDKIDWDAIKEQLRIPIRDEEPVAPPEGQ